MNTKKLNFMSINPIVFVLCILLIPICIHSQDDTISFNSDNWQIFSGKVVEHLGRQSLAGSAMLKDVEFENGVIEFDISVTGERSYPGIRFRAQSRANAENIYIRPHIIGISQDALQYTPIFNNEACWQLYNGDGFTSGLEMPKNEWVHVRMEISGSQARVYVGDVETPSLKIEHLKHGKSKGGIVLISPPNGSAHFSNFRIDKTAKLNFEPPLKEATPPGILNDWEISQPFKYIKIDLEKTHAQQGITDIEWQKVSCEKSGLVNVSSYIQRKGREPDFIFGRTTIESDTQKNMELRFGYSDWIVIFLNGKLCFPVAVPIRTAGLPFLVL